MLNIHIYIYIFPKVRSTVVTWEWRDGGENEVRRAGDNKTELASILYCLVLFYSYE